MAPVIKPGLIQSRGTRKPAQFVLNPNHPLSRGLVCCVPLGDTLVGQTKDVSVYNNAGIFTASTPTFVPSHHGGRAVSLSGSSQFVAVPNTNEAFGGFSGNAPITMSLWVNWVASTDTYNGLITNDNAATGTGFALLVKSNQKLAVYFSGASTFSQDGIGSVVPFNSWHHIVATYNGSAIVTYIDGVLNASNTISGNYTRTVTGLAVLIGADDNNPVGQKRYFNGSIEGARIYNRALTASEVAWLYAEPYAGLVAANSNLVGATSPAGSSARSQIVFCG